MTGRRTVYRSQATIAWGIAGVAINAALVIGMFVSILGSDSDSGSEARAIAVAVVLAAIVALLTYRLVRRGVFVEPNRVVVRSIFRNYSASWADVDRFEIGRGSGYPNVAVIRLKSGGQLSSPTIYASPVSSQSRIRAEEMISELNEILRERTGPAPPAE